MGTSVTSVEHGEVPASKEATASDDEGLAHKGQQVGQFEHHRQMIAVGHVDDSALDTAPGRKLGKNGR